MKPVLVDGRMFTKYEITTIIDAVIGLLKMSDVMQTTEIGSEVKSLIEMTAPKSNLALFADNKDKWHKFMVRIMFAGEKAGYVKWKHKRAGECETWGWAIEPRFRR